MELDRGSFLERVREKNTTRPTQTAKSTSNMGYNTTPKAPKAKPGQVCHWNGGRLDCRRASRLAHPSSLT